jgi:23S rRNA pseudouridine1911/1915/1917 synthase
VELRYIATEQDAEKTALFILKERLHLSKRLIQKLKNQDTLKINHLPVTPFHKVSDRDILSVELIDDEDSVNIEKEAIPLEILYEDEYLIVLNKPTPMVVHPTSLHQFGTLANGLSYYFHQCGLKAKIRPVTRLDKDTSGAILFAKHAHIQEQLIKQMSDRRFEKEYFGIVHGMVEQKQGTIDLPIARNPNSIMLREISMNGDPSITHYAVLCQFSEASFIKFYLETGRTHQIRVHCQAIGHPLIGDSLYSSKTAHPNHDTLMDRQALHAHILRFIHPILKHPVCVRAPIPHDMLSLLLKLKKQTTVFND